MRASIAEFKRRMTVGSKWAAHSIRNLTPVVRECTHSQTNSFALMDTKRNKPSWCDWPKKFEAHINIEDNIMTVSIFLPNVWLVYKEVKTCVTS